MIVMQESSTGESSFYSVLGKIKEEVSAWIAAEVRPLTAIIE